MYPGEKEEEFVMVNIWRDRKLKVGNVDGEEREVIISVEKDGEVVTESLVVLRKCEEWDPLGEQRRVLGYSKL